MSLAARTRPEPFADDAEARLEGFIRLVAAGIAGADAPGEPIRLPVAA